MSLSPDPYDKKKILDALAHHAWNHPSEEDHKLAFQKMGIKTEAQLRDVIERGIDASNTRAFKAQPVMEKKQVLPREIYELPLRNAEGRQPVVIVNPGLDKHGQLAGGTCYVPGKDGKPFDIAFAQEKSLHQALNTGHTLCIVQGGRPALREQERHQQLSIELKNTQLVVQPTLPKSPTPQNETLMEKLDRERRERGEPEMQFSPQEPKLQRERKLELKRPGWDLDSDS